MLPAFLLPETEIRESGYGPSFDLGPAGCGEGRPDTIMVTLGVTDIIEHESLDIAIQGSEDGVSWLPKPLGSFSQKFYCGTYQLLLNLQPYSNVRYLRPRWKVDRWGRAEQKPLFGVYLFIQEQHAIAMAKGAA